MQSLDPGDLEAAAAFVGRVLDEQVDTLLVAGDDAMLGTLLTAYLELHRRRPEPLSFALADRGGVNTVARSVGAEEPGRSLSKLEKRLSTYRARLLPTLRVVDSTLPVARLGFGFGLGAVTEFASSGGMRRRDTVRHAVRGGELVEAELLVDWERRADGFGYLLASAVPRTWGKVDMGAAVSVRVGSSLVELLAGATRVGRAAERVAGGGAKAFERVHVVTNGDYVVDGIVMTSSTSRVVSVEPGPRVRFLAPGRY